MPYIKSQEFYNQLKTNSLRTVYIFAGEDVYQQQEACQSLFKSLNVSSFDSETFFGSEFSVDNAILAAQTMPFMSEKRLILVKDSHKIKTADLNKLSEFLKTPTQACYFILLWPEKINSELKRNAFFKIVEKSGIIVDFRPLYDNELPSWIQKKVKSNGKKISIDAIQYLIEETGSSLLDLDNEINKLLLFIHDKNEITLEDVEILSGHTKQINLNHLQESIETRNLEKSLVIIENLLNEGEVPLRILGTIYRTVHKLLIAKSLALEEKHSKEDIRQELNIHPYFAPKFFNNLSNYSIDILKQNINLILEADIKVKSSSKPHYMIFEELLYNMYKQSYVKTGVSG
ncbi:MAG: DNA polymerase III subunit delta [Endomicrobiales bacterium]|nr:DNA polymerase III subunit delta [Endomicrobiales bacterium]